MCSGYEIFFHRQLEQQAAKYELATLYSRLLEEWLTSSNNVGKEGSVPSDDMSADGSFAMVEDERLEQLREKVGDVIFTPLQTDRDSIIGYLKDLFSGEEAQKALSEVRKRIIGFAQRFAAMKEPFDERQLKLTIKGLLKSDLLSDQKRTVLEDFQERSVIPRIFLHDFGSFSDIRQCP